MGQQFALAVMDVQCASIRGESRWSDLFAELNTCLFDVLVICEHGVGKGMGVSSRKKVSTSILGVVPLIGALEFAYR